MQAKVNMVLRILLGLMFTVFGANKLISFLPPPEFGEAAMNFFGALATSGYFFITLGLIETASGVLLLINRYVGLALAMLAPITINVFLFHIFLAPEMIALAIVVIGLNAYLAYANRDKFSGVLSA
jgi:hypothetical protein